MTNPHSCHKKFLIEFLIFSFQNIFYSCYNNCLAKLHTGKRKILPYDIPSNDDIYSYSVGCFGPNSLALAVISPTQENLVALWLSCRIPGHLFTCY